MTPITFLRVLRARRWLTLSMCALSVSGAVAVNTLLPPNYTATTTLLVDVKSADPVAGAFLPPAAMPTYMSTQVDIIQSERVIRRVIEKLELDRVPALIEMWRESTKGEGSIKPWLSMLLLDKLSVKPARDSNVLTVSFKGVDPVFAATIANAVAQAYMDTLLEMKIEPAKRYALWFDGRSKSAREELERAQSKLSGFQRENGITSVDERLDVENARLAELSSQLVALQAQLSDARSRESASRRDQAGTMPEVLQNSLVQGLKADVARQEAKLQEMQQRLGQNHPQYQSAATELNEMRQKLDAEIARVQSSIRTTSGVASQKESEIRAALEAQRAKVLRLKQQRDQMAVLQRDVDTAQRSLEGISQRLTQTNLESAVNQTNVSVLAPAEPPVEPSFPKPGFSIALSILLGFIATMAVVLAAELRRPRVRDAGELATALDLPLIASVPRARPLRKPQLALPATR